MIRVCHISTVHTRYDVRIFQKECKSLAAHYEVHFIVADGKGDEQKDNVSIWDVGVRQTSRLKRARIDSAKAYAKAIELQADVYHFHDPELSKIGLKLQRRGNKVIYDVHEDLPRQIFGKPYLPEFSKPIVSRLVEWQENKAARKFDYICTATPFIRDRFLKLNRNTLDINNYPIVGELHKETIEKRNAVFCYTGGITRERGIQQMIQAFEFVDAKLLLAGPVDEQSFLDELKALKAWEKVEFFGLVDRVQLGDIMSQSLAGLVLFLNQPNHVNAQPNKIFEYMSSQTAVVGSDFPLWKELIEKNKSGLCVNPESPKEIAEALQYLMDNNDVALQMGKAGFTAVHSRFNWKNQEQKLFGVYKQLIS